MKKTAAALLFVLMLCILPLQVHLFASDNIDTLSDWNVRIAVPAGATAVLNGNEYYIYAQEEGSIPYVMVRIYPYGSEMELINGFTDYMREQYADLKVSSDAAKRTVGGKDCYEIDYSYTVSGYEVKDRRIVIAVNEQTYMFTSKEIESIGMTVGNMLDDVVADCEFLTDRDSIQNSGIADAYLYCQNDGMPKYWLDFTAEDPVLHCYFRSGKPSFYERTFTFDLASADSTGDGLIIHRIRDMKGNDCSDKFSSLTLQFYLDGAVMTVERDESTLSGSKEDKILPGVYAMRPAGVAEDSYTKEKHIRPAHEGPYEAEELGMWVRILYFEDTGLFPSAAEVSENTDKTFTIRLSGITDAEGTEQTASYTVNASGEGKNDATGQAFSLRS